MENSINYLFSSRSNPIKTELRNNGKKPKDIISGLGITDVNVYLDNLEAIARCESCGDHFVITNKEISDDEIKMVRSISGNVTLLPHRLERTFFESHASTCRKLNVGEPTFKRRRSSDSTNEKNSVEVPAHGLSILSEIANEKRKTENTTVGSLTKRSSIITEDEKYTFLATELCGSPNSSAPTESSLCRWYNPQKNLFWILLDHEEVVRNLRKRKQAMNFLRAKGFTLQETINLGKGCYVYRPPADFIQYIKNNGYRYQTSENNTTQNQNTQSSSGNAPARAPINPSSNFQNPASPRPEASPRSQNAPTWPSNLQTYSSLLPQSIASSILQNLSSNQPSVPTILMSPPSKDAKAENSSISEQLNHMNLASINNPSNSVLSLPSFATLSSPSFPFPLSSSPRNSIAPSSPLVGMKTLSPSSSSSSISMQNMDQSSRRMIPLSFPNATVKAFPSEQIEEAVNIEAIYQFVLGYVPESSLISKMTLSDLRILRATDEKKFFEELRIPYMEFMNSITETIQSAFKPSFFFRQSDPVSLIGEIKDRVVRNEFNSNVFFQQRGHADNRSRSVQCESEWSKLIPGSILSLPPALQTVDKIVALVDNYQSDVLLLRGINLDLPFTLYSYESDVTPAFGDKKNRLYVLKEFGTSTMKLIFLSKGALKSKISVATTATANSDKTDSTPRAVVTSSTSLIGHNFFIMGNNLHYSDRIEGISQGSVALSTKSEGSLVESLRIMDEANSGTKRSVRFQVVGSDLLAVSGVLESEYVRIISGFSKAKDINLPRSSWTEIGPSTVCDAIVVGTSEILEDNANPASDVTPISPDPILKETAEGSGTKQSQKHWTQKYDLIAGELSQTNEYLQWISDRQIFQIFFDHPRVVAILNEKKQAMNFLRTRKFERIDIVGLSRGSAAYRPPVGFFEYVANRQAVLSKSGSGSAFGEKINENTAFQDYDVYQIIMPKDSTPNREIFLDASLISIKNSAQELSTSTQLSNHLLGFVPSCTSYHIPQRIHDDIKNSRFNNVEELLRSSSVPMIQIQGSLQSTIHKILSHSSYDRSRDLESHYHHIFNSVTKNPFNISQISNQLSISNPKLSDLSASVWEQIKDGTKLALPCAIPMIYKSVFLPSDFDVLYIKAECSDRSFNVFVNTINTKPVYTFSTEENSWKILLFTKGTLSGVRDGSIKFEPVDPINEPIKIDYSKVLDLKSRNCILMGRNLQFVHNVYKFKNSPISTPFDIVDSGVILVNASWREQLLVYSGFFDCPSAEPSFVPLDSWINPSELV